MAGAVETDSLGDDSSLEVLSGTSVEESLQSGFQRNVERRNLLNLTKLAVKSLIESAISSGKAQDDSNFPLQQLFIVLEHVLRHILKNECSPNNGFLTYPVPYERVLKSEYIVFLVRNTCTSTFGVRVEDRVRNIVISDRVMDIDLFGASSHLINLIRPDRNN